MKKYWYRVSLINGVEVTHYIKAADISSAKREAKKQVRKLFPRKKLQFTDVYVKRAK